MLQAKLKNAPTDTSLVCSSVSSGLNKDESPSDQNIVLTCNNSEENHQQHRVGLDLRVLNTVYVLNKRGLPLMPTCQSKARRLLGSSKAKVVKRYPFTIQLTITTGENKKEVVLGIDAGFKHMGISAVSKSKELFAAEVILRTNVSELMSEKKMYRRGRRNRHHWYREPRFDNRRGNRLAPSIRHKVDSHTGFAGRVGRILPVSRVVIETAKFDIQKINNPEIGSLDYQKGVQTGFWNVREYVLYRDNHTCQYCKKTDLILNVHHIESRQTGGNRPDNLLTLCEKCHDKLHKGKIELDIKIKDNFKAETCMSTIRKSIIQGLRKSFDVEETFGYITKSNRIDKKIEKSHINDAFVIAGGSNQVRNGSYLVEQKRKNNRCLQLNRKGFAPAIRRCRYKLQPKDLVKVDGKMFEVVGTHCNGSRVMVSGSPKKISIAVKKVGWSFSFGSLIYKERQFLPCLKSGVSLPEMG